jgi:hypothetical protein
MDANVHRAIVAASLLAAQKFAQIEPARRFADSIWQMRTKK